jgi:hypothetical protein
VENGSAKTADKRSKDTFMLTRTHTYAELEISDAAFDEIETKLRAADYQHAFETDSSGKVVGIIMQGIMLVVSDPPERIGKKAPQRFDAKDSLETLGVDVNQLPERPVPDQTEMDVKGRV